MDRVQHIENLARYPVLFKKYDKCVFKFGKYKGKKFLDVMAEHLDYIIWLKNNNTLNNKYLESFLKDLTEMKVI